MHNFTQMRVGSDGKMASRLTDSNQGTNLFLAIGSGGVEKVKAGVVNLSGGMQSSRLIHPSHWFKSGKKTRGGIVAAP
jgi:hypothetical protein